jgi:hypothetical protein
MRICCILDYLNACVLQKRAWPNSINSSNIANYLITELLLILQLLLSW